VVVAVVAVAFLGYAGIAGLRAHRPLPEPGGVPLPPPASAPPPVQNAAPARPPAAASPPAQDAGPNPAAPPPVRPIGPQRSPTSMLVSAGGRTSTCGADNADECGEELTLPGGAKLQVYDNFPMSGSAAPARAVVVVHGTGRNASGYYQRMMQAARAAGAAEHVMVVAPWFKADEDDKPKAGEAVWQNDAWKKGYAAERPAGLSSFTVMDDLVASLADSGRFPNMKHITITGHSAGGQFTQRYAAFGKAPAQIDWVGYNFAVMNPSSYVYFDNERPNADGSSFALPGGSTCPDYSEYKYGLDNREGYPAQLTERQAVARYASRTVAIVNGGADNVDNGDMDTDCAAMLQGPNRSARGQYYYQHFHALHPAAPHSRIVVPGVAHDSKEMFASPRVRSVLFGG
jgi:hypothetical protein